ncbi:MAG: type II secretion system protein GspG, partial [Candidatus Sumerlaeota bacterium]|nr:type II secretion system protein GspG [Candidatus Sumerlaeota bacterium]
QTTGELPPTLDSLGWRLHEVFRDGNPLDPWGNAFLYRVPGSQGRAYDLLSSGPDGKPGTTDDVGFPFSE